MFLYLIVPRDSKVHTAIANKGGNVGSREKYESDGEVLDESDI